MFFLTDNRPPELMNMMKGYNASSWGLAVVGGWRLVPQRNKTLQPYAHIYTTLSTVNTHKECKMKHSSMQCTSLNKMKSGVPEDWTTLKATPATSVGRATHSLGRTPQSAGGLNHICILWTDQPRAPEDRAIPPDQSPKRQTPICQALSRRRWSGGAAARHSSAR